MSLKNPPMKSLPKMRLMMLLQMMLLKKQMSLKTLRMKPLMTQKKSLPTKFQPCLWTSVKQALKSLMHLTPISRRSLSSRE